MSAEEHLNPVQFRQEMLDRHTAEQEQFKTPGGATDACGVSTARMLEREPEAQRWMFSRPSSTWGPNQWGQEHGHEAAVVQGHVVDWTARQFHPHNQDWPHIEPLERYKSRWGSARLARKDED